MRGKIRLLVGVLSAFGVLLAAEAVEVTAEQASRAAGVWARGGAAFGRWAGAEPDSVESLSSADGSSFHVVQMKNGGFVVMGTETSVGPVIAFSSSGRFGADPKSPLTALLKADLAARAKATRSGRRLLSAAAALGGLTVRSPETRWARLLADGGAADSGTSARRILSASSGVASVSDMRVDALVKSAWAQEDYRNYGYAGDSEYCYNYYTPNHWPCGCVATVGAQIMRYHAYPSEAVSPATYACKTGYVKSVTSDGWATIGYAPVRLTMQGGTYSWADMPLVPADGCTEAQRQAIGKLTSDLGIACGMAYSQSGGSSPVYMLTKRLVDRFGYANAVGVTFDKFYSGGAYAYSLERLKAAVVPNLDAGLPVALGISGTAGGHAVIGDGYGYSDGEFFMHINLGWANALDDEVWYMPPDIDEYTSIQTIVYNIYPTGASGLSIVSGRIYDESGRPAPAVTVTAETADGSAVASAVSDENGIYALRVPAGSYLLAANKGGLSATRDVQVEACVSTEYTEDGLYTDFRRPSIGNIADIDLALSVQTFAVALDANGGAVNPTSLVVQVGRPFGELPTPTWNGHVFEGWTNAVHGMVTSSTVVSVVSCDTLAARWRANRYMVRYHANGGTGAMADQPFEFGEAQALSFATFANGGLYFAGWAETDRGDVVYHDGERVSDLSSEDGAVVDLYAVWSAQKQTTLVSYDAAGGTFANGSPARGQTMQIGRCYEFGMADFPEQPVRPGYVFNGWWGESEGRLSYFGGVDGPTGGICVDDEMPSRLMAGWDDPFVVCKEEMNLARDVEIEPIPISVAGFDTPGIVAGGLPPGLSLSGNAIVGTPKKSGVYQATFSATSVERKDFTAMGATMFVVRADETGEHAAYARCDGTAGKVAGGGIFAAGASVSLKASANKGYVFDRWGWVDDVGEAVVSGHDREPSLRFMMPAAGDVRLEAEFVEVQKVSDSICAWTDNGDFGGEEGRTSATLLQGVYREWHLAADAMHPVGSIKVSGLPSGLKFTAKAIVDKKTGVTNVPPNTIYGYPSAVSKKAKNATAYTPSAVTVSVTTDSKITRKITWQMTVLPLPEWAIGTFSGHRHHKTERGLTERSMASLTVGKTGKISGKFNTCDSVSKKILKWTFSADGFVESDFDGADGDSVKAVRIRAVGKSGKFTGEVELVIDRTIDKREPLLATARATGDVSDPTAKGSLGEFELWRNIWKDKGAAMTEFAKTYSHLQGAYNIVLDFEDDGGNLQSGYLTLKVDAKGGAKVAGKLPDGASTSFSPMLSYQDGEFTAMTVVEPSAYKGGFASVVLQLGDKRIDGWGDWLDRSSTTGDVNVKSEGGVFSVRGSLYDKTVKLSSFSDELFVFSDIPSLEYAHKEKSSTGVQTVSEELAEPRNEVRTALAVDAKDKLKAVASSGKPAAVDKVNGIWNYDVPNVESVTVSFTPSTGVFKGSYVGWYDYISSVDKVKGTTTWSHASKKYAFEGVWVQDPSGETAGELTGFIMFDRTGWQTDAKTGKQKSYKYKVNRRMGLGKFSVAGEEMFDCGTRISAPQDMLEDL